MGIKLELSAQSREPLDAGTWEAKLVKFDSGESSNKHTPFVQPVFKVLDEDAVRTDGETFTGNLWGDKYWVTPAALFRLKQFMEEFGSEFPEDAEYDTIGELAAELTETLAGTEVTVVTGREDYVDKNDEDRQKAVITQFKF